MTDQPAGLELILVLYPQPSQAGLVFRHLLDRVKKGDLKLVNAAVIVKEASGKTHLEEIHDLRPSKGSFFGAITGALVGLLGGPVGAVVGGVVGATTGAVVAGGMDLGFSDKFLKQIKGALQPGQSALLAIVEPTWAEWFIAALEPLQGQLFRDLLKADVLERLQQAQPPE